MLNLAAGFDTRPYRLALPPELLWVEADLPALIAEKEQLLAGEQPRCQFEREAVDLSDAAARSDFLTTPSRHGPTLASSMPAPGGPGSGDSRRARPAAS